MKALLAMAPVGLAAMAYAPTQGKWDSAGTLAVIEVLIVMHYRAEKRNRSPEVPNTAAKRLDRSGASPPAETSKRHQR